MILKLCETVETKTNKHIIQVFGESFSFSQLTKLDVFQSLIPSLLFLKCYLNCDLHKTGVFKLIHYQLKLTEDVTLAEYFRVVVSLVVVFVSFTVNAILKSNTISFVLVVLEDSSSSSEVDNVR